MVISTLSRPRFIRRPVGLLAAIVILSSLVLNIAPQGASATATCAPGGAWSCFIHNGVDNFVLEPQALNSGWVTLQQNSAACDEYWVITSAQPGEIYNACYPSYCLDAYAPGDGQLGDRVQVYSCNGQPQQLWWNSWSYLGSTNPLVNSAHGMCLDADTYNIWTPGDHVQLWACTGQPNQTFSNY